MPLGAATWYESRVHAGVKVPAVQEPGAFALLQSLVEEEQPDVIIELGTCSGGVTMALHEVDLDTPLFTFDIALDESEEYVASLASGFARNPRSWYGPQVHFCRESVLHYGPGELMRRALAMPGKRLMACDNGHKRKEVQLYAPWLHAGDVLGVHDWGEEIHLEDVAESLRGWEPLRWEQCENLKSLWRFWRRQADGN